MAGAGKITPEKLRLLRELRRRRSDVDRTPEIPAATGPAVASPSQQGMWFLDQTLGPDEKSVYNLYVAVRLRGDLDHAALRQALRRVATRHEPLRTVFRAGAGRTPRVFSRPPEVALPVHDLTDLVGDDRLTAVRHQVQARAREPFSLTHGPLWRTELFRLGPADHVFLVSVHHIVFDGWSTGILFAELADGYGAGRGTEPPPLPVRYADFAAWQRLPDQQRRHERQLAYWRRQLAGVPERLDLPADRTNPTPGHAGADLRFVIGAETALRCRELARGERTTLFTVLLAAFQVLLARYSGQRTVCVGTPVAGRGNADLEQVIGLFVNTVVLRADLDDRPTFRELVAGSHATTTAALEHQDVPFEQVVERLRPPRVFGHNPLYQVMFVLRDTHAGVPDLPGLATEPFRLDSDTAKLDLTLDVDDGPDGLRCVLNHRTDLFSAPAAARLAESYSLLLDHLVARPDRRVDEHPVLSAADRERVVRAWNDTATPVPETTLDRLCRAAADASPSAPAVIVDGVAVSYSDLERRASALAARLVERGAGPGGIVAVVLPRSVDLVVALLAVLKAGAAFLPIDPGYPARRIAMMLADADPVVALATTDRPWPVPVVVPAEAGTEPAGVASVPATHPDSAAYVIYTSGSTGRPKGVVVTHRAIVNRLCWMQDEYGLAPGERVLQKTPIGFDVSVWEFFWPLTAGATVVLAAPGGHRDTTYLAGLIRAQRISTVHFVPSMLAAFLRDPASARCGGLRRVICSGEALTPELRAKFHDALDVELHNLYGPTEAAIDVSHWPCPPDPDPAAAVPIGRPVWNTRLYVLDERLRPVPPGVAGELYIGGVQLARGYLNRPASTAAAFLPDPFGGGGRIYRTGDRARWRAEGTVEYLGRLDDQVKLRGFRIEPGEIRAAMIALPDVDDAAVIVREDRPGDRRLVGYAVGAPGREPDDAGIRAELAGVLPEHMVPSAIVVLPELPVTANGKLDKAALPPPVVAVTPGAPRTPREELLCDLFADVLGTPGVGVRDDFFELGGDSIGSLQLVGGGRRAGVHFTVRDVFRARTPAGLAAVATEVTSPSQAPAEADGAIGLVPVMRWWLDRGGPIAGYHQSMVLCAPETAGLGALTAVLQAVIDKHDMLRARLADDELVVAPAGAVRAEACLEHTGVRADAENLAGAATAAMAFLDPVEGRMLRAVWFDHPGARRLLLLVHHLAVDAVSWRVLMADLAGAWAAVSAGSAPVPARPGSTFGQWSALLRRDAANRLAELARWQEVVAASGEVPLVRPLDARTDTVGSVRSRSATLAAPCTAVLLTELPAMVNGGVDDVLLTVLALALRRWTGTGGPLRVNVERHGREDLADAVDVTGTVGWFTSVFPVRLDVGAVDLDAAFAGGQAAGTALKRIKEQLRSLPDNGIGYGELRYLNEATAARLAGVPHPHVCFNYLGRFAAPGATGADWTPAPESPVLSFGADPGMPVAHAVDVVALTEDRPDGPHLRVTVSWPDGVLLPESADRLLRAWADAADALARHAGRPDAGGVTPSDLSLAGLDQEEIDDFEAWLTREEI